MHIGLLLVIFCVLSTSALAWRDDKEASEKAVNVVKGDKGWWDDVCLYGGNCGVGGNCGGGGCGGCYCSSSSSSTTTTTTTTTTTSSTTTTSTTTTSTTTTSTTTSSTTTTSTTTTSTTTTSTTTTSTTTTTTTTTRPPITVTVTTTTTAQGRTEIIVVTDTVLPCHMRFEQCYEGCPYVDVPMKKPCHGNGHHHHPHHPRRRHRDRHGSHPKPHPHYMKMKGAVEPVAALEKAALKAGPAWFTESQEWKVTSSLFDNSIYETATMTDDYYYDSYEYEYYSSSDSCWYDSDSDSYYYSETSRIWVLPSATSDLHCWNRPSTIPSTGVCNWHPTTRTVTVLPPPPCHASTWSPSCILPLASTVTVTVAPSLLCTRVMVCATTPLFGAPIQINTYFPGAPVTTG